MRLSARRVRKLRRVVESQRCPEGPGLVHHWEHLGEFPVELTYSVFRDFWQCVKCGAQEDQ